MIQKMVLQWWQELKDFNWSTWATTVVLFLLVLFGLWNGHQWYSALQGQKAQFAMSEAFEEYDRAVARMVESKDQDDQVAKQQMEDAVLSLDVVIRNHSSSPLVGCAHAFKADVYWYGNQKDEAIASMELAIKAARKSPLIYVYKTKSALMKLDAGKADEGTAELLALAQDQKNPNADMAAYQLGCYYWGNKDEAQARDAWKLLERFESKKDDELQRAASPYLAMAQMKMGHISE